MRLFHCKLSSAALWRGMYAFVQTDFSSRFFVFIAAVHSVVFCMPISRFIQHNAGVPAVAKFLKLQGCPEIVVKSQSFGTDVRILTIVVRAQ